MLAYYTFALCSALYAALYLYHCVRTRQKRAARGAALLVLTALAAVFLPAE